MALLGRVCLAVPLTLALCCGRAFSVAHALEDASALIQGPSASASIGQGSQEVSLAAKAKARWPDLENLWDEVKDSVEHITDEVGEITDEAVDKVDEFGQKILEFEADAAKKVAAALNRALGFVQKEADLLLNETIKDKTKLYNSLNASLAFANGTVLPEFESAVHEAISGAWARWENLRDIVDRSANVVTEGLSAAGQGKLATTLESAVNSAEHELGDFMQRLKDADDGIDGIGQMQLSQAEATLHEVDADLNKALQDVANFVAKYTQSFQDTIDKISNAMTTTLEDINREFSSVHHNLTSISWRVRSSGRELILGLHQSIVQVCKAVNLMEPEWHPISMPVRAQQVLQSAAPAHNGVFLALLAAASTVLCAAASNL